MLTKVEVRTPQGTLLNLPLQDVSNGFIIEDIKGLGPVKATLVSSSFAGMDGQQFQSSRRESRNIVMKIGLEPDYSVDSVEDLRHRLYEFFMPKAQVDLRFCMSNTLELDISGRVETFEEPLFTDEPAADISILCFDPDLYDATPVSISGNTVSNLTETTISYSGTVETGIEFELDVNRSLSEFTIYHRPPGSSVRQLDFAASLVSGDVLKISTVPGSKYAKLTRTGTESSILYGVSPQSNWIELQPGDNQIRVYAEGAAIPFTMAYTTRYGGL